MGINIPRRGDSGGSASEVTRGSRYKRDNDSSEAPPTSRRGAARSNQGEQPQTSRRGGGTSRRGNGEDSGTSEAVPKRQAQRGWAGSKRTREETSDYADRYKLNEQDFDLIAFAENEPFDSAPRHFINDAGYKGQRAFICPGKKGPYACPLCRAGDKPMPVDYFNIALFDTNPESDTFGIPVMKVWECGPGYSTKIATEQNSRAVQGDLTSCYFEAKGVKSGNSRATTLELNSIKPRDLKEDWGVEPLTDEEWEPLMKDCKGDEYVQFSPERVLQEAADKLDSLGSD